MRVSVNTSSEKEFILIATDEGFTPESFLNDKFCEELSFHFYSPLGNLGFNSREKLNFHHQITSINGC